ncbi:hypothetical protein ACFLYX_03195 [Chloroflexota bacterium]
MKQRKYEHDYFNAWRDTIPAKYIWLQVNYLSNILVPYHLISETNDERDGHIIWPFDGKITIPLRCTSLDFRRGNTYDFSNWHLELSNIAGCEIVLQGYVPTMIHTYEDYIRKANLSNSSCVDIDVIECLEKKFIGIEGTHLFKPMTSRHEALRLFGYILSKRLFLDNAHQLIVQKRTLDLLSGNLYLLIYNTRDKLLCEQCNSLLVRVDDEFIDNLKYKDKARCFNKAEFAPFNENYKKIIENK